MDIGTQWKLKTELNYALIQLNEAQRLLDRQDYELLAKKILRIKDHCYSAYDIVVEDQTWNPQSVTE